MPVDVADACNHSCRCCAFTQQLLRTHYDRILTLEAELDDLKELRQQAERQEAELEAEKCHEDNL